MIHLGDITKIQNAPFVNCVTFGSPCQDLSIAGKRAGLSGERSGLFMEAVRIIKEMREQSEGLYPAFAVWENVPGAFSSNKGEDFRAVLEELARIEEPEVSIPRPENGKWAKAGFIAGNGWSIAWRTFDAQFWGVPQRRRRIAVVVDFGGQRAGEVLFERTGVSGNPESCIPPWKGVARNPARRAAGYDRVVEDAGECLTPWDVQSRRIYEASGKWPDIYAGEGGGHGYVCFGVDGYNGCEIGDKSITIRAGKADQDHVGCVAVCAAFTAGQGAKANGIGWAAKLATTLKAAGCGSNRTPTVLCRAQANTNAETYENLSPTLTTCHDGPPIVFRKSTKPHSKDEAPKYIADEISSTLNTFDIGETRCNELVVFESHSQDARYTQQGVTSPACTAQRGTGGNNMPLVVRKILRWTVRRLTPTECERLQGFPDGWTDIGEWIDSKGKRHKPADSPRYKALGNSIALPQWWWITCKMAQYLPEHATLGSLFDGIGGFPLVWETRHGKGTAVWASEIEEFPIAVTKKHFGE